jgi:hypothetical protein
MFARAIYLVKEIWRRERIAGTGCCMLRPSEEKPRASKGIC